jgi:hypothetical protein
LAFVLFSDKFVHSLIDSFSTEGNDFTLVIRMTRKFSFTFVKTSLFYVLFFTNVKILKLIKVSVVVKYKMLLTEITAMVKSYMSIHLIS